MGGCTRCNIGYCAGSCGNIQPTNPSNKTIVVPVEGESAYEAWKSRNPSSTWTEAEWLENYVKGDKGDKGDGVQIKGSVPTYSDLANITPTPVNGDTWAVDEDGMLYTYSNGSFPAQGSGISLSGDTYIPETTDDYFTI